MKKIKGQVFSKLFRIREIRKQVIKALGDKVWAWRGKKKVNSLKANTLILLTMGLKSLRKLDVTQIWSRLRKKIEPESMKKRNKIKCQTRFFTHFQMLYLMIFWQSWLKGSRWILFNLIQISQKILLELVRSQTVSHSLIIGVKNRVIIDSDLDHKTLAPQGEKSLFKFRSKRTLQKEVRMKPMRSYTVKNLQFSGFQLLRTSKIKKLIKK